MTELDAIIGPLALDLIDEFGKLIKLTTVQQGVYDIETGSSVAVDTSVFIKAIVEKYKGQEYTSGLIETGDKKVTIAGQSVSEKPTTSDTVEFDGEVYTIQNVKAVYSGELIALYEMQARQ